MNAGFTCVPFPILLSDLTVILKQRAVDTKRTAVSLISYQKGNQRTKGLRTQVQETCTTTVNICSV